VPQVVRCDAYQTVSPDSLVGRVKDAGSPVVDPRDRALKAAAASTAPGDRYEVAVALATAPHPGARARGEDTLRWLGAVGTLAAV
jgi:hypothetical protein